MSTRAQSALIAPGSNVTALRTLFAEFLEQPTNREHIAALMAGADARYDMATEAKPPTSRWAPDLVLGHSDRISPPR
jgi:hypothetical protein